MGWFRDVLGGGGSAPVRLSSPSTRDREKAAARKAKETAAHKERVTAYKRRVARGGKGLDFDTRNWD